MRTGQGWDIHRLKEGNALILGGVSIASDRGCEAHSDGDALAHAIIDALLGAAALDDIGTHFPDTDPDYEDADSMKLLAAVVDLLKNNGYRVVNIDTTVILQAPRLRGYIDMIRRNIAGTLSAEVSCVSIKAKTSEGLGPVGTGAAIEAQASVLIEKIQEG
jgi:2-C-methyl-D-erythritol 2,4-cyclodiphosphate synthase